MPLTEKSFKSNTVNCQQESYTLTAFFSILKSHNFLSMPFSKKIFRMHAYFSLFIFPVKSTSTLYKNKLRY